MSVALIELVEMTATLNVVVSINSTTVMQTYWTAPYFFATKGFAQMDSRVKHGNAPFSVASYKKSCLFFHYSTLAVSSVSRGMSCFFLETISFI